MSSRSNALNGAPAAEAREAMRQGKCKAALELLAEAVKRTPDDWSALQDKAMLEANCGLEAEARRSSARALSALLRVAKREPTEENLLRAAAFSEADGRFADALALYRRASRPRGPRRAEALLGAARLSLWLGRGAEARKLAAELGPGHAAALRIDGAARLLAGRAKEAVGILERAAAADPANPESRVWLGEALRKLGRGDEARRALDEALALPLEKGELVGARANQLLLSLAAGEELAERDRLFLERGVPARVAKPRGGWRTAKPAELARALEKTRAGRALRAAATALPPR